VRAAELYFAALKDIFVGLLKALKDLKNEEKPTSPGIKKHNKTELVKTRGLRI
jgi:hypothetical protein